MIEVALRHAYRDVAVEAAFRTPARVLALFGDSGAGKTTVLNAIAGLLTPSAGRIVLDGTVLFDHDAGICLPVARRQIGYVFQDGRLFPHLSVRANLLYGARARGRDGADFDRIVDLLDLGALLARMPAQLSGGERQRVAIGRALLSAPRILLLDEPLTGLHREARDQVLDHLVRLKLELGLAMLLVSHQPAEAIALADEVVLMQSGAVLDQLPIDRFAQRQLGR
ncbi:MAG: ATP-binding cassette domain-containing protein [Dokdonella sp.]|nr:ATP-binding cassette domain-containing protein [Dokdonella sp.]